MILDQMRASEQPQPQTQRFMSLIGHACIEARGPHSNSPPATTMLCPVTDSLPGRQSHVTAFATSSGWTSRPCGLDLVIACSASSSLRPVTAEILAAASLTRSVSVYPG